MGCGAMSGISPRGTRYICADFNLPGTTVRCATKAAVDVDVEQQTPSPWKVREYEKTEASRGTRPRALVPISTGDGPFRHEVNCPV